MEVVQSNTEEIGALIICCSFYLFLFQCVFCLVWFYGISTIVGYLMPNPLYTYILDI